MKTRLSYDQLYQKLKDKTTLSLSLKLNENTSTYLSVTSKKQKTLRLSLHKWFLNADDKTCDAVIRYSLFREKRALQHLKVFTHKYFVKADQSHLLVGKKLKTQGKVYNLQEMYERLNRRFFQSSLNLSITWFKKPRYKNYSCITYGSYQHTLRLIRMNEIIDDEKVPFYFVEFILYHEMLHAICESQVSPYGKICVHTRKFKELEKKYPFYTQAREWEKENFQNKRRFRGWT